MVWVGYTARLKPRPFKTRTSAPSKQGLLHLRNNHFCTFERRTSAPSAESCRSIGLDDPAAADDLVFLIKDGGLAGGDGALGLVEEGVDGRVVDAVERGHGRGVAM